MVGGGGSDGGVGLELGGEGWRWRRPNVRPSAKPIARRKRTIRPRIMLHFLVKILCGFAGFCSLGSVAGVVMVFSLVRGDLNTPPDDILSMVVIRFDSAAYKVLDTPDLMVVRRKEMWRDPGNRKEDTADDDFLGSAQSLRNPARTSDVLVASLPCTEIH